MKTNVAAGLLLTGLLSIVISYFIGGKVAIENEMTPEWDDNYAQLSNDVHARNRRKESDDTATNVAKLTAMHEELAEKVEKAEKKGVKKMFWYAGLSMAAIGMCIQVWSLADSKD